MAEAAELMPTDEVLEIGPGLGILTRILLDRAGRVVAVELDRELVKHLPTLAAGHHLEVVHADALRFDPAERFRNGYKLVANLPYQITSPVLSRYLLEVPRPQVAVLMLQLEVAERIAAPVGQSSFLSILVQSVADVKILRRVPPGAFFPRPKVTSAVVRICPLSEAHVAATELQGFRDLARAGFAQPRKTLANSLALGLGIPRREAESLVIAAGLDPQRRPQQLGVADWLVLLRAQSPLE